MMSMTELGLQPGHCGSFISNSINTQPNSILFIILKIKEIKKKHLVTIYSHVCLFSRKFPINDFI